MPQLTQEVFESITVADPTDLGTLRPDEMPIKTSGSHFQPLDIDQHNPFLNLPNGTSATDSFTLFRLYYTDEIINSIVNATNSYTPSTKVAKESEKRPHMPTWQPTSYEEIITYLAIRIYMSIHPEYTIDEYWRTSENTCPHPIVQFMTRDRFKRLHIRYYIGTHTTNTYSRVSYLL